MSRLNEYLIRELIGGWAPMSQPLRACSDDRNDVSGIFEGSRPKPVCEMCSSWNCANCIAIRTRQHTPPWPTTRHHTTAAVRARPHHCRERGVSDRNERLLLICDDAVAVKPFFEVASAADAGPSPRLASDRWSWLDWIATVRPSSFPGAADRNSLPISLVHYC